MRLLWGVLCVLLIPAVFSLDQVMVNSADWQDVYSGMLYASLEGAKGSFLVDERDAFEKVRLADTQHPETLVVESASRPIVAGYTTSLAQQGLIVEKMISEDLDVNVKLAKRLRTNRFIIVDDTYGYNAVSVAPFAVQSKRYVLFVNAKNLASVERFLSDVANPDILVYGYILRDAQKVFEEYEPEILNEQDRFLNNMAITKRFLQERPVTQVTFSNGEFLEPSLFFGNFPTVFIGKSTTPQAVKNFIVENRITSGVLVGNALVNVMRQMRDELNLSVFIRFSQGRFNEIRDLDLFFLPISNLELSITNIYYDPSQNKLIVTYKNIGPSFLYFRSSIGLYVKDELLRRIGDEKPVFLEASEIKSVSYDLGDMAKVTDAISAKISTVYGESPQSQEFLLDHVASVEALEFRDDSSLRIISLTYDEAALAFFVEVENTGPVPTYVHLELQDVKVGDLMYTLTVSGSILLQPAEIRKIKIPANLLDEDYPKNPTIAVSANYGKERTLLIHQIVQNMELFVIQKQDLLPYLYGLGGLVVVLVFVILVLTMGKRKRKQGK